MKNMGNMSQYEIITKHNITRCKLYTCCEFQPYMVFHGNSHATIIIPPLQLRWKGGILVSPCLSVHPSVCPSVDRMVSALYLQQYLSDLFHISISYQATTEGVLRVLFLTKLIYSNENYWILIQISLKLAQQDQIDNKLTLVQIMAWSHMGEKLLSETMIA